jgi:hypothetical protein
MKQWRSWTEKEWAAAADMLCKKLMIGLIALLAALFVAQAALRFDHFRHWASSVERLEGQPLSTSSETSFSESAFCIAMESVV